MKLGDMIREYRLAHDFSQRQLAIACGLSNGYISILEKGINPKTGKPVTPTIPQLKKLSAGMGMTLMELLDNVDDMPIDIGSSGTDQDNDILYTDLVPANEMNVIRIAARDGSYEERQLTDQQLAALKAVLDQMPDASGDL